MDRKTRKSIPSVLRRMMQERRVLIEAPQEADDRNDCAEWPGRFRRIFLPLGTLVLSIAATWLVFDFFTIGTVVGHVTDLNGHPVAGATVQIEGQAHSVLTDADGAFVLDRVRLGEHRLLVQVPGKGSASVRIHSVGRQQVDCGTVKLFAGQKN